MAEAARRLTQEGLDVVRQPALLEALLQVRDDGRDVALAVAAAQDLGRRRVEPHHALGVEQHPGFLGRLVLQTEQRCDAGRD